MRDEHRGSIGKTIARLREEQGWSQRQLAKWVDLDQSAVSRIEAGRRRVSAGELQRLADAFRVSADTLLTGVSEETGAAPAPPQAAAAPIVRGDRLPASGRPSRTAAPAGLLAHVDESPGTHLAFADSAGRQEDDPRWASLEEREAVEGPEAIEGAEASEGSGASEGPAAPEGPEDGEGLEAPEGAEAGVRPDAASPVTRQRPDSYDHRTFGLPHPAGADSGLPHPAGAARARIPPRMPGAPSRGIHAAEQGRMARRPRLGELPADVADVVRDWFELRALAGGSDAPLAWSTGHSAEGRPARHPRPLQSAEHGSLGGDVLYDRVARFWRSELHVEPDDGPLPDLVSLLEDGLGIQVIAARVPGPPSRSGGERPARDAWSAGAVRRAHDERAAGDEDSSAAGRPVSSERPVCAAVTLDGVSFLFVNAARPVVLQRFALAHAFAHLALGHGDVVDERILWSRNNPPEAAANDFAEELLLPVRAARRWYERRGDPRPEVETMLELGNAFGISAWSALYRSRAAGRLHAKQFSKLNHELRSIEWEILPRQAFLGGLRDTLTHLTPQESLPPGRYGAPAVLRVPGRMRAWALAALQRGDLSPERAAACLRVDTRTLALRLTPFGRE